MLLDNGADPNIADANGYTSLHRVVRDSDYGIDLGSRDKILSVVKSLLKHGANPNVRLNQDKEKAAEEIKNGNVQTYEKRTAVTVNEIILQGATPLFLAAEVNNLDVIKALVEAGADPLIATERGTTPLMMAAGGGTDVQLLLKLGASTLDKTGVVVILQRSGDLELGNRTSGPTK